VSTRSARRAWPASRTAAIGLAALAALLVPGSLVLDAGNPIGWLILAGVDVQGPAHVSLWTNDRL
jgi:hypothetical protein